MASNHERRRSRSRSRSPRRLSSKVKEISEKDFFLKNDEFRAWLKEEKNKYFTELTGEKAHSYFRKFVKEWNKGRLASKYYDGIDAEDIRASSTTSYKWAFASSSKVSEKDLRDAIHSVAGATNKPLPEAIKPVHGPTLPGQSTRFPRSTADRQYELEEKEELDRRQNSSARKRARAEEADKLEDILGPREVGREKIQENKRARRETDRAFREKSAEPELDQDALMGGGDSFRARIAQRDAARKRFEEKRRNDRDSREASTRERADAIRQKDQATMDMFKALAKERFG